MPPDHEQRSRPIPFAVDRLSRDQAVVLQHSFLNSVPSWNTLLSHSRANCISGQHKKSVTTQLRSPVQIPDVELKNTARLLRKDPMPSARSGPRSQFARAHRSDICWFGKTIRQSHDMYFAQFYS